MGPLSPNYRRGAVWAHEGNYCPGPPSSSASSCARHDVMALQLLVGSQLDCCPSGLLPVGRGCPSTLLLGYWEEMCGKGLSGVPCEVTEDGQAPALVFRQQWCSLELRKATPSKEPVCLQFRLENQLILQKTRFIPVYD